MTNQPKQKTAIRQAIEILEQRLNFRRPMQELNYDVVIEAEVELLILLIEQIKPLEPVNERQIKDAYYKGYVEKCEGFSANSNYYFNENFEKP